MANKHKTYLQFIGQDKTGPATKSAVGNLGAIKGAAASLAATMAPLAGAAGLAGFASMVKGQIDAADKVQKLSLQLGVSTEALSQYRHVAELTGTSFESMTKGIRYMQKNMSDAEDGLSTAKRAFSDLNLEVSKLRSLSPEDAFERIGQALSEIEEPAKRTQLAMNVFGRAGAELNQTFADGAAGVRAMRDEADRLGLTLSQDSANAAATANDEMTKLRNTLKGMGQTIAMEVVPSVGFMAKALTAMTTMPKNTREELARLNEESADFWAARRGENSSVAFATPFLGMGEAAMAAGQGVHVFGGAVEDVIPSVRAAATVAKDLTDAFRLDEGYQIDGLFDATMLAEIDAYVDGLEEVKVEGSQAMTIMADAAYDASRRMADSIANAVFESENLLQGFGNVAKSVFGSILSGFISIGVQSILPVPGVGAVAGAIVPGGDLIGPQKSAGASAGKSGGVSVGNLNVSLSGNYSSDPMSVRRLAVDIYDELQKVGSHHG